jgi:DNA-binding SARP family transcriptional activator
MLLLNRLPDFLLAVIASWTGLSLLVRAPRDRLARAFAWFCLHLMLYGLTALLAQLTASLDVARALDRLNIVETLMLPPSFLQFIMALTRQGRPTTTQRAVLWACYAASAALGLYALLGPMDERYVGTPAAPYRPWLVWGEMSMPDGALSWLWVALRVLPLLYALWLMARAYRGGADAEERLLRRVFTLSAVVGVIGASTATAARTLDLTPAFGRALILVAMVVLAYGVLAYRALLPARVAQRTFFYSLLGSLITTLYVGLLLLLEAATRRFLAIDAPVVAALMLVVLVAALGPLREWFRSGLDRRFYRREFDYGRLLKALSADMFERGDLPEQLRAALSSICRTLGVSAGLVAVSPRAAPASPDGQPLAVQAVYGPVLNEAVLGAEIPPLPTTMDESVAGYHLLLPLRRGDEALGVVALGPKRSGQPFSDTERTLLAALASYLAAAIGHAGSSRAQQHALELLASQSQALAAQQEELAAQAAAAEAPPALQPAPVDDTSGLRVSALGTLHAARDSHQITRWGGDKAGTYQAEALFAFLFDRRGRGLTKDEAEEVIWPDLQDDIERADQAFHRTLSALRRTLEPGLRRGSESRAVLYHHERYWLEPSWVAWADTDAFAAAAERGATLLRQGQAEAALAQLRAAADLYRGDYMDACRFFGDSFYVEERRSELRAQYAAVLLALAQAYERLGQAGEALSAYRRAEQQSLLLTDGAALAARAVEGISRLSP